VPARGPGWAHGVVALAQDALRPLADPDRAAPMAAYLRDQFPFLGIPTPQRAAALRAAWAGIGAPSEGELTEGALALWALPEREFQYAACDLLTRWIGTTTRAAGIGPGFLADGVRQLITTASWWDSVDALRSAAVGPLVAAHPQLRSVMSGWVELDDRWLVRSAIIHQLGYGDATDADLLFALCARRAGDREFFVAKAIGWALRTYARRRPDAVREFVGRHSELTPLARREALKHLGPS
jgi:3-methyladenine DNA glycosylase AlkD